MYEWCPSEMWSQFAASPVITRGCSHAQRLREKNLDKKINGYNLEMKIKLDSTLKIKKIKKLLDIIFYVPQKWAPPTVGSQPHGNLLTKPNRVILVVFPVFVNLSLRETGGPCGICSLSPLSLFISTQTYLHCILYCHSYM